MTKQMETIQWIGCECGQGEELPEDEQRWHSQTFKFIRTLDDLNDALLGLALYKCPCGKFVVSRIEPKETD